MDRILRVCTTAEFLIVLTISISLVPVFFSLGFGIYNFKVKQANNEMVDDGLTTIQELLKAIFEAKEDCLQSLKKELVPVDKNGVPYKSYCKGEWDQITCWPSSAPGSFVSVNCPEYIEDFDHKGKAHRECGENGSWSIVRNGTKTWVDYSGCRYPQEEELEMLKAGDPLTKNLITLYTVGYSCSLVALIIAVFILAYFKRLHCTRNFIHMHLFVSFILRAVSIFVKDRVLYEPGSYKIETESDQDQHYLIGCKVVITLFHYFVATNYYWILVEALYLHSLIFVAFFSDKKYLWRFTLTGWGAPLLFVLPWAIVRAELHNTGCWDIAVTDFKWIYNGPIVVANVINFLLFLNIIRVLWSKMRDHGSIGRSDNARQYMKLAKSTLVLIPMFGVHAIVFIGMPDNISEGIWWQIRMYFDLFFNSFQGFFVAIIYCFCNGEVQAEFRKAWSRFHLSFQLKKGRRDRSRSSVTMLTSFNSTTSQQGRLSIGGQSSVRGNRSNGNAPSSNSGIVHYTDTRPLIVQARMENMNREIDRCETSFVEKSIEDKNSTADNLPLISPRSPFVRVRSASAMAGHDVILPIKEEEEPDLEEVLCQAVEKQIECPANSFSLADSTRSAPSIVNIKKQTDEFDDILSTEESFRLREQRTQRSKRAVSEDSGISSTSTFYSILRGRERNPSAASNSEYCGDSEGYAGDDAKRHSGIDNCLDTNKTDEIMSHLENSISSKHHLIAS